MQFLIIIQILSKNNSNNIMRIILITFIILFTIVCHTQCQFNQSRLRIVDQNQGHFLVRGNVPIQNSTFCFEKLYDMLSQLTNTTNYRIVIINLLHWLTARQTKNRYISQGYFNRDNQIIYNKINHLYQSHSIIGSMWNPIHIPNFLRKLMIQFYDYSFFDQIPTLLANIVQRMNSPKNTIIYIYSHQGIDRVGYVTGAYLMKNYGLSFREVMKKNFQVLDGVRSFMASKSYNGLQWYCLYLKRNQQQCEINNSLNNIHLYVDNVTIHEPTTQHNNFNKNKKNTNN